jgi:hypothetical protein
VAALGRNNGRSKVYAALLAYAMKGPGIVDKRAVSSILDTLELKDVRSLKRHLAWLHEQGWIVRVRGEGHHLKRQRGSPTSLIVLPRLLESVPLLPPNSRAKAQSALRRPAVSLALLQRGAAAALRVALGEPEPPPDDGSPPRGGGPAGSCGNDAKQVPLLTERVVNSPPMGRSPFVDRSSTFTRSEITTPPTPPRSDLFTPASAAPPREGRGGAGLTARPLEPDGPAAAPPGRERDHPAAGAVRLALERGEHRACPQELEAAELTPSSVAAELEARGVPRSEAVAAVYRASVSGPERPARLAELLQLVRRGAAPAGAAMARVLKFAEIERWRRERALRGEPPGRAPRTRATLRAVRRELARPRGRS